MSYIDFLNIALPVVYALFGVALIVAIVFVIKIIVDLHKRLKPTLNNIQQITEDLQPTIKHADQLVTQLEPMVDRLSLTLDAANLELVRVDKILENAGEISSSVSSLAAAIDAVSNVPINAVNNVSSKVAKYLTGIASSTESTTLGRLKAASEKKHSKTEKDTPHKSKTLKNPLLNRSDAGNDKQLKTGNYSSFTTDNNTALHVDKHVIEAIVEKEQGKSKDRDFDKNLEEDWLDEEWDSISEDSFFNNEEGK